MSGNLLITMSGGTTSVINATLAGIIKTAQQKSNINRILAGCPGIKGALEESIVDLTDLTEADLERLYYTPASGFIGTTRVKPMSKEALMRLADVFVAHGIRYFINIGGSGTIKQSIRISKELAVEVNIAAVPKTVDNDLGDCEFERVLYTPGFPSCANYWRHKIRIMNQENLGAFSHDRVLIAQTFGRKTGFLAGCARLGDVYREIPLIILLPEDQRPLHEVLEHIKQMVVERNRAIVILSEGYDLGDIGERYDLSGQVMYGTSRTTATQLLVNHCADIDIQARGFVPGFDQRSDVSFVSTLDLQRAYEIGRETVERLKAGERNFLTSISKDVVQTGGIEFTGIPFAEISDYSRVLPDKWISCGNFDVADDYVEYAKPLIGEPSKNIPVLTGKTAFISPLKPSVEKKLQPWGSGLICKKETEENKEVAAQSVVCAHSFES